MIFNIYSKLRQDFYFLEDNGFKFLYKLKHNIIPSIMYQKNECKIQIGYDYENNLPYIYLCNQIIIDILQPHSNKLFNVKIKEQLKRSVEILKEHIAGQGDEGSDIK